MDIGERLKAVRQRYGLSQRELAKRAGKPMQTILDEAIDQYQRDKFLDEVNAAYARLRADPEAWKEELDERQDWNGTLMDGLENE